MSGPALLVAVIVLVSAAGPARAAELCLGPTSSGPPSATQCDGSVHTVLAGGYRTDYQGCAGIFPSEFCTDPQSGAEAFFSVGASPLDPSLRGGPIFNGELFLWFDCSSSALGWNAAEFGVAGDVSVLGVTFVNGVTGTWDGSDVSIRFPCAFGRVLLAILHVEDPLAVETRSWGRTKAVLGR